MVIFQAFLILKNSPFTQVLNLRFLNPELMSVISKLALKMTAFFSRLTLVMVGVLILKSPLLLAVLLLLKLGVLKRVSPPVYRS